jgi:hypothetical protein
VSPWLDVPVPEGSLVRLEPLSASHADDLAAAAEEDRSSYGFALVPRARRGQGRAGRAAGKAWGGVWDLRGWDPW